jgi:hypothetical protein
VAGAVPGGVIARLVGTHVLLSAPERARLRGFLVNKFRGDPGLFADGMRIVETRTGMAPLGILPWFEQAGRLPAEDALALPGLGTAPGGRIKVAVPMLARIASFDDLDPLRLEPDVMVELVPPGRALPGDADLVLLPGMRSAVSFRSGPKGDHLLPRRRRNASNRITSAGAVRTLVLIGRKEAYWKYCMTKHRSRGAIGSSEAPPVIRSTITISSGSRSPSRSSISVMPCQKDASSLMRSCRPSGSDTVRLRMRMRSAVVSGPGNRVLLEVMVHRARGCVPAATGPQCHGLQISRGSAAPAPHRHAKNPLSGNHALKMPARQRCLSACVALDLICEAYE